MEHIAEPTLDSTGAVLVGPRPAPAVTQAWTAIATAARCDPPAPPRLEEARRRERPEVHHERGSWFPGAMDPEMFEASPIGIVLTTQMGYVIDANPAFLAITGRPWQEMANGHLHGALGLASKADLVDFAALTRGGSVQLERTCRHRSGRALELELTVVPLCDETGEVRSIAVHVLDVTGQREAERGRVTG